MGSAGSGPKDSNSFAAALRSGSYLPPASSLTYQGVFNEHKYQAGAREEKASFAVSARAGRVGSATGTQDDVWISCFLKSCRDGQPRDDTAIDVVAVLDVSGSMGGPVSGDEGSKSRLCLAKEALLALLDQLRADDRFGIATFTSMAKVLQTLKPVGELNREALGTTVQNLTAGGGTTLAAGMEAAVGICAGAGIPSGHRERRLLFLTDMDDLNGSSIDEMIKGQADQGLYMSFVCLGMGFNSSLAEEVTKHRGCNYFCITRDEELQKVVVDDFAFNFFPAAFSVEVALQSDHFDLMAVYGTAYDTYEEECAAEWQPSTHRFYPEDFKQDAQALLQSGRHARTLPSPALQQLFGFLSPSTRTVVRVDTIFPSGIEEGGIMEGGLLLMRLRPRAGSSAGVGGTVRLLARHCEVATGEEHAAVTDVEVPALGAGNGEDVEVLSQGVMLQRYVEVCRNFLSVAEQQGAEEGAGKLDSAMAEVRAFHAELEATPECTDRLCPDLRKDVKKFVKLAETHLSKTTEQQAS